MKIHEKDINVLGNSFVTLLTCQSLNVEFLILRDTDICHDFLMFSDFIAVAQWLLLDTHVTLFIYEKLYRPWSSLLRPPCILNCIGLSTHMT